jgi:hypothetical protein
MNIWLDNLCLLLQQDRVERFDRKGGASVTNKKKTDSELLKNVNMYSRSARKAWSDMVCVALYCIGMCYLQLFISDCVLLPCTLYASTSMYVCAHHQYMVMPT